MRPSLQATTLSLLVILLAACGGGGSGGDVAVIDGERDYAATVTITVVAIDDSPMAHDDTVTTAEDSPPLL